MEITRFGQSCLLVVDRGARLLLDPGNFAAGFESLTDLTAVLITHQHTDHLDMTRVPALLTANPQAAVYADTDSAAQLAAAGIPAIEVSAGQVLDLGTPVSVHGDLHAVIHRDLPVIPNVSYLIGERLLQPGDALHVPDAKVEILALPSVAPWMALKEAIDYYRAVDAPQAFPIHDALAIPPSLGMYYGRFSDLGPAGSTFHPVAPGETVEL